jgi:glycosyltransferase involved in cell wall biosynthesis
MSRTIDILIPTFNRSAALAVTLTSLISQSFQDFAVIISDQTEDYCAFDRDEVKAAVDVLKLHKHSLSLHRHLPPRGMAEQRQFLLDQATAPFVLFLDDDLILEPYVIRNMITAIQEEGCGFVGSSVIGLRYLEDYRPHEQQIEFWEGPVQPEEVRVLSPEWNRIRLHNAANLLHVQEKLGLTSDIPAGIKLPG